MMRYAAPTLAVLGTAACTAAPPIDLEAERAALRAAATAYHDAAGAKNRAAVLNFYADDAMMVPPDAPRVGGIEAVRNYRFGFIETPGVSLRFETLRADVSTDGTMGWTLALGDIAIARDDAPPTTELVQDFHVWKKHNGEWKITIDMWNSAPPP